MIVQRYFREQQTRRHKRNIKAMEDSFDFFTVMKIRLQTESQIKIAYQWRRYVINKKRKLELRMALEEEQRRQSD